MAGVAAPACRGAAASVRVVDSAVDPRFGPDATMTHLLPYVKDVLPAASRARRELLATPPPGLLRLGRQRLLIDHLRPRLLALSDSSGPAIRGGGHMPTRASLVSAGHADLVRDVDRAGGFAAVALAVGLRSRRRPVGYWDNMDNLDAELGLFVAAHWVELAADGGATAARRGGRYFYNVATRRVKWDAPIAPAELAVDDAGTTVRVEDEAARLMPGRAAVLAAGRYDLHHAIVYHGGYRAVADALDRPPAWPPSAAFGGGGLARELRAFATAGRRTRARVMPSAVALADAGRQDLIQAIAAAGGFHAAADAAGLRTARRRRGEMADLAAAGAALADHARQAGLTVAPTLASLTAAGRFDLRYAAQLHGAGALAAAAGLPPRTSGPGRRAKLRERPGGVG